MDRLVDSKGWTAQVDVRSMLARWSALVGPVNAAHSHPESYTDTVLTVRADSTAWATQLRLLAPRLVATLNTALGDGTVTRVTVLGPDAPSWKRGRLSVRDGRGPRDTYG
jgi:predicted nucleic acid-binding Zn ribbon protein